MPSSAIGTVARMFSCVPKTGLNGQHKLVDIMGATALSHEQVRLLQKTICPSSHYNYHKLGAAFLQGGIQFDPNGTFIVNTDYPCDERGCRIPDLDSRAVQFFMNQSPNSDGCQR